MEFFDRKEEVLDLQLTQYGKYLLSVGKLKPAFYAFFDDDVDYDTEYQGDPPKSDDTGIAGPNENQKDTEDRIKETPRIKVIHSVDTVEKSVNQISNNEKDPKVTTVYGQFNNTDPFGYMNPFGQVLPIGTSTGTGDASGVAGFEVTDPFGVENPVGQLAGYDFTPLAGPGAGPGSGINAGQGTITQPGSPLAPPKVEDYLSPTFGDMPYKYPIPKKQNTSGLKIPLGTSKYNSIFYPAYDLNLSKGEIKESIYYDSGSYGVSRIPQIEIEVTYETTIGHLGEDGKPAPLDEIISVKGSDEPAEFNYVKISDDGSYIKIEEDYISIDLKELNSLKEKENFVIEVYEIQNPDTENEILLPLKFGGEYFSNTYADYLYDKTGNNLDAKENYVEHFFKVSVDNEIQTPTKTLGVAGQPPSNDFDLCEDDNEL